MTAPSRHLVTTTPRRATCGRCKRVVLEGIADGMPYRVDALPLTLTGEVHARIAGHMTYRLLTGRLIHRDQYDIALDARTGRPPVAATHTCTPVDPSHIDPTHAATFAALTTEPPATTTDEQDTEQHSLFVLTGAFAGARVIAVPADDQPPF